MVSPKKLEEKLRASSVDDRLPCAVALQLARKLRGTPKEVGAAATKLKIRIINCQLGCFQTEKSTHDDLNAINLNQTLAEEIEASLVNDRLPCAVALQLARKLRVTPKEVGDTATKQKTKIVSCQLGCFP